LACAVSKGKPLDGRITIGIKNLNRQHTKDAMKTFISSLVLALSLLFTAEAAEPRPVITNDKPIEKSTTKKPKGMPFNGTISAVDKNANTISIGKQKVRIFHLSSNTKITRNKAPSTINDVAAGDHVGGYAFENAEGKLEVKTLNLGEKAKAGEQKEKKL
jgi:hypothetical protein